MTLRWRRKPNRSAHRKAAPCRRLTAMAGYSPATAVSLFALVSRVGRRPARRRCPGVQHVLGHPDLLVAARAVRGSRATVGPPGAGRELQTAGVAVTGADRPVATGLAGSDRVPVHAVGPDGCLAPALRRGCLIGRRRGRIRGRAAEAHPVRAVRREPGRRCVGSRGKVGRRRRRIGSGRIRSRRRRGIRRVRRRRVGRRCVRRRCVGAGTNPAASNGMPTVFGSQRTSSAAKAVALDSVSGAVASTPVIAAMVSVWRTFFNIVPFAGARAEVSPAIWAGACVQAGLMLRVAPSRSGTTAGA